MRLSKAFGSQWVFPPLTKGGHMESSTLKKQHNAKTIPEAPWIGRKLSRKGVIPGIRPKI